jgi:hypothetical protein
MFVCIATTSSEVESLEDHVDTWKFELQAGCALDHSSLPNNAHGNHCDMLRLI